jgi:coenzyme F420-0:L-glutamate ligase/coenzyme F420-1:gamma-L-glutamate ligase
MVAPGDDVAALIRDSLQKAGIRLQSGDVIAIAQKIISKAEDRYVSLADVEPGTRACELAAEVDKDPRLVQLILDESRAVVRKRPGVLIVEHRLGYVHANAGIDQSNIAQDDGERALLLPLDSDASAQSIRQALQHDVDGELAVLINDSAGRAWRNGTCGMAIGVAGFEPVWDMVGDNDLFGNELRVTTVGVADELAAAASLLMGQGKEGNPVVIVRNAPLHFSDNADSSSLIRDREMDLFR